MERLVQTLTTLSARQNHEPGLLGTPAEVVTASTASRRSSYRHSSSVWPFKEPFVILIWDHEGNADTTLDSGSPSVYANPTDPR